jgi:hypothetical protein
MKSIILGLGLFLILLTSCDTLPSKQLSVSEYEKETIERQNEANIFFVRPAKLKNYLFKAEIDIAGQRVGQLLQNEKAKVFINEGIHQITVTTISDTDTVINALNHNEKFSTRFEKGKNYYFVIEPSYSPIKWSFPIKQISRIQYLKLTNEIVNDAAFVQTVNTLTKVLIGVGNAAVEIRKEKEQQEKVAKKEIEKKREQDKVNRKNTQCTLIYKAYGLCIYNCDNGERLEKFSHEMDGGFCRQVVTIGEIE